MPAQASSASTGPIALDRADVGIGLRQPHYQRLLDETPPLGFVEVHSENFFAPGGAALAVLQHARECYPVSLHGVGLALGSAAGLDPWHVERLHRLVERTDPVRVSDHASFARVARGDLPPVHASDLLPIARTQASLDILVRNVDAVQERLRRPILVENVSAYLSFADDAIDEPAFFASLCRRSGCRLLLDLNNLMVNAVNALGIDGAAGRGRGSGRITEAAALERCCDFVDAIPPAIVGEIHLAGYAESAGLAIDDHGSPVRPAVWTLFEHALSRLGPCPVLIEWDTALPALDALLAEAGHAATLVDAHRNAPASARAA
jgi:uncharacterized protein (UPF0276 family)